MADKNRQYRDCKWLEKKFKDNPDVDKKDLIGSIAEEQLTSPSIIINWAIKYRLIPLTKNWKEKKCENCGKKFPVKLGRNLYKTKYCNPECVTEAIRGKDIGAKYIFKDGKRIRINKENIHKLLKLGMKKYVKNGYTQIWDGKQWQIEHRYIFEKYLGRKLIKGEVIHHRDGNKSNNELKNLQLQTESNHSNAVETKHSEDISKFIYESSEGLKKIAKIYGAYSDSFMFATLLMIFMTDKISLMNNSVMKNMLIQNIERFIKTMKNPNCHSFKMVANLVSVEKVIKLLNSLENSFCIIDFIGQEKSCQFQLFKDE